MPTNRVNPSFSLAPPPTATPVRLPRFVLSKPQQPKNRAAPTEAVTAPRVSSLVRRFVTWSLGSVLLAIAVDVALRLTIPMRYQWFDVLILSGITVPLLLVGGVHFLRRAALQERALRRRDARQWAHARRDLLTQADNRQALEEVIAHLNHERPGLNAALFVLDLHEFQHVNDACGHAVGDDVLREFSRRLRGVLFDHRAPRVECDAQQRWLTEARVVRVGSDEIALWMPGLSDPALVQRVAQDLLATLDEPFEVGGLKLNLRGHLGYVLAQTGQQTGSDWLTRANVATQHAKQKGEGLAVAFVQEHLEAMVRRHDLQHALQEAVKQGTGFYLEYQPIVSLELRTLMGCEALLRWKHPEWGPISPAEFIPVAESSDLIRHIGRWVLAEAMRQMARWQKEAPLSAMLRMKMSVNLSRAQLHDPDLVPFVAQLLHDLRMPASALRLEVTESLPLDDPTSRAALEKLSGLGVPLALDDFGTGYSSLSALLNLPLRGVKIDRQFVKGIDRCLSRQTLVTGVVKLADIMGLEVVAEGVEHEAEAHMLVSLGCHQMQGWLVSRSLVAEAFEAQWLAPPAGAQT